MREHLYRGKAINRDPNRTYRTEYKNGDWVFGLLSKLDKYGAEMTNEDGVTRIDVDPETICEFTGFKDKFGKKIFEDDIVKVVTPRQHAVGIVKVGIGEIDGDGYKFIGVYGEIDGKRGEMVARSDENYEVIGNIYDTPELLSKGGLKTMIIHTCLSIEGAIRNAKDLKGCLTVDGKTLDTVKEIRDYMRKQLTEGKKSITYVQLRGV